MTEADAAGRHAIAVTMTDGALPVHLCMLCRNLSLKDHDSLLCQSQGTPKAGAFGFRCLCCQAEMSPSSALSCPVLATAQYLNPQNQTWDM